MVVFFENEEANSKGTLLDQFYDLSRDPARTPRIQSLVPDASNIPFGVSPFRNGSMNA